MCLSCFCRKPLVHLKSVVHDKPESSSSLPDPGYWDPNYSDELLLQDDSSELNNMTMGVCKLVKLLLLQNLLVELGDLIKCQTQICQYRGMFHTSFYNDVELCHVIIFPAIEWYIQW
ncbi:hypothetical protein HanHA300_Chr17g0662241 [Helianthus annuus]|nr:hypothetical protein HanHA300_Chr17g0662241 [Helianthus annuus]